MLSLPEAISPSLLGHLCIHTFPLPDRALQKGTLGNEGGCLLFNRWWIFTSYFLITKGLQTAPCFFKLCELPSSFSPCAVVKGNFMTALTSQICDTKPHPIPQAHNLSY